jgi:hypothetical protein
MSIRTTLRLLGSAAAAVLLVSACAGQDDIDRTQANRLPKAMFDGTWYVRSTITDVPGTATSSFVGRTGSLEKIRWQIQEDWLLAYRAYEEVPGTDSADRAQQGSGSYQENPIAAFPIDSHFDIKRDYNAATGEQFNVIGENTMDRPWYEREWIRVDWSNSTVDGVAFWGAGGKVDTNVQFFVQQHEDDPDALRVEDEQGRAIDFEQLRNTTRTRQSELGALAHYFDMVGRFVNEPEVVRFNAGGRSYEFPLCWFIRYRGRNYQTASCGPTENRVRVSFMRADERNFEPVELPNREMGKFGYFRTERFVWDRRYGLTESGRVYLANVHNIWEGAYETDEEGKLETNDDGEFIAIPLEDRIPRPLVYHLNPDYPCELVATAQQIAGSWNKAFRKTVAVVKGLMTETAGDTAAELAEISKDDVPDMFVLDTNGWMQKTEGDDWSCENLERDPAGAKARLGDLRYNFIAWVPDRQMRGPLGYGPSSADPETGEIVAGMAHVYGAAVDRSANSALDIVRLLNDDLVVDDLVSGEYVREYIQANQPRIDPAKIPRRVANLRGREITKRLLKPRWRDKIRAIREGGLDALAVNRTSDPFERLKGTALEKHLVDEEVLRGIAPTMLPTRQAPPSLANLTQADREALSPSNWMSPVAREMERLRWQSAAQHSIWLADFADDSIQGLATELWRKYGKDKDYATMWQLLRELIFRGVMEHEIGHTIGLRHNFSGSFDSVNYHNAYWDLRTKPDAQKNGGVLLRDPLRSDQQLDTAQLYQQAVHTEDQVAGRMREYQYSSIMDYHAKFNSDVRGIGKYDEAAVLFGYGGYVEVFDELTRPAKAVLRQRYDDCLPRYESIPNPAFDALLEQWHYSSVWNLLGQTEGLVSRRFRRWSEIKAEQQQATDGCDEAVASGESVGDYVSRVDTARDAEVPYMFCSDEYVGATQSCQRWDQGADAREQIDNVVRSYKSYYFFNNFKRDRFPFDAYSSFNRAAYRYFAYLPNTYQHWLFETQLSEVEDPTQESYWTMAMLNGINLLFDVLATPEYGTYCKFDEDTGRCDSNGERWGLSSSDIAPTSRANRFVVNQGTGRRRFSRYDYESGYSYQYQILETGHFWEYLAAINALTSEYGTFVGREVASDFTTYLVPYYLVFDEELTRYFDGVVDEDYEAYAPRIRDGKLALRVGVPLRFTNGEEEIAIDPATGEELADQDQGEVIDMQNWFTLRYYTLIMGMGKFRALYSLRYVDRQQVFRLGSGDEVTPGEGKTIARCEDPIGGHVYGTVVDDPPADAQDAPGGAAELIRRCQAQVAAYKADPDSINRRSELEDTIEWLNFMRGLYGIFGHNVF